MEDVWKVTSVLEGHSDGITSIYGMYTGGNDLFVFTSSIDSTVKVWERSNGNSLLLINFFILSIQTKPFGKSYNNN